MDSTINIMLVTSSVIIGFIGLYFVLKILAVWKKIDINVLKARAFLDPNFLVRNWIYIFIAGALIVIRRMVELLDLLEVPVFQDIRILFDMMGLAVITSLVLLAYYWHKLVDSAREHKNR